MNEYCESCGTHLDDEDKICPECGADVSFDAGCYANDQWWECGCGCEPNAELDECPECGSPRPEID